MWRATQHVRHGHDQTLPASTSGHGRHDCRIEDRARTTSGRVTFATVQRGMVYRGHSSARVSSPHLPGPQRRQENRVSPVPRTAPWLLALFLAGLLPTGVGAATHAATPSHPAGTALVHGSAHEPSRLVQFGQHTAHPPRSAELGGVAGAGGSPQPALPHATRRFLSSLQTRAPPRAAVVA